MTFWWNNHTVVSAFEISTFHPMVSHTESEHTELLRQFNFDQYGRYAVIRDIINTNRTNGQRFRILDVGGRGNILKRFLPNDDVWYLDPYVETTDTNYIAGDGCNMPLEDKSFEWVVSADTLEHIPQENRVDFLREQTRVSSLGSIIIAPFFSPEVQQAEITVNETYKTFSGGRDHPWLVEHIQNGLPNPAQAELFLQKLGHPFQTLHNNRLSLWTLLMNVTLLAVENNYTEAIQEELEQFNEFYNTTIYPHDADELSYRTIYYIRKDPAVQPYVQHNVPLSFAEQEEIINRALRIVNEIDVVLKQLVQQYSATVKEKDQQLTQYHSSIKEFQQAAQSLQKDIVAAHKQLAETQQEVVKRDHDVQSLQSDLKHVHHTLHQKELVIQEQGVTIHSKDETIHSKDETIHSKDETITTQQQQIGQLDHTVKQRDVVIQQRTQQIVFMESSKFWKLRNWYIRLKSLRPHHIVEIGKKALGVWKREGTGATLKALGQFFVHGREHFRTKHINQDEYGVWIEHNEQRDANAIQKRITQFTYTPTISVLVPVYNMDPQWLQACIDSVTQQSYPHWELCLYDDASTKKETIQTLKKIEHQGDARVRVKFGVKNKHISGASNEAVSMATGEFVALLDHDDELSIDALYEVVRVLQDRRDLDFIYSDEDKYDATGKRIKPFFKPGWSPDLFLSMMYTAHLGVYRRSMINNIGGFRLGYEGAQDYDLVLRLTEAIAVDHIAHIPKILYHWRQIAGSTSSGVDIKGYAQKNSIKALTNCLQRRHINATIHEGSYPGRFRIKRKITGEPLVSIIIPFRDQAPVLKTCVRSILNKTAYKHFELLLVDNQSTEPEMKRYLNSISKDPRVRVIAYGMPFNYSAINNYAVKKARGEYVLLLNNDTEVITEEWLSAMVEHIQRPEVGAVGAKLLYPNNTIQHAGVVLGLGGVAGHAFKYFPADDEGYFNLLKVIRNVSGVTGACLLTKKALYERMGGLDEKNLSVAFNDVDFCLRIRKAGYWIVWTPYAQLYHYESLTRGNDDELHAQNPQKFKRVIEERQYMPKKWGNALWPDPLYSPNLTRDREDYSINLH